MNTVGSEQSRPEGRGVSHLCCSKRYSDCTPSHWRARMGGAIGSAPSGIQAFESREAVREVSLCPAGHNTARRAPQAAGSSRWPTWPGRSGVYARALPPRSCPCQWAGPGGRLGQGREHLAARLRLYAEGDGVDRVVEEVQRLPPAVDDHPARGAREAGVGASRRRAALVRAESAAEPLRLPLSPARAGAGGEERPAWGGGGGASGRHRARSESCAVNVPPPSPPATLLSAACRANRPAGAGGGEGQSAYGLDGAGRTLLGAAPRCPAATRGEEAPGAGREDLASRS